MANVKEIALFIKTGGTNLCNITTQVFLEKLGGEKEKWNVEFYGWCVWASLNN